MSLLAPPADPASGDDILAWAVEVTQFLRATNPQPGPDIWPQVNTTGTTYLLKRRRAGTGPTGATRVRLPLEPFASSTAEDLRVSITWGTIAGLELDDYGPTTITETTWLFGKLTVDTEGVPSTLELHTQNTATPPANTDTVAYLLIGRAVVAGEAMSAPERNLAGSQAYERCGFTGDYSHTFWLI